MTSPRIHHCLRERCPGPRARGQSTPAVLKGEHALVLIHILHLLTPTCPIDQSQTEDVTHPILLEIRDLIPGQGPEVDLIPKVTQGLIDLLLGRLEVDQGVLLHSLDHCLVLGPDTGLGQEAGQTLDTEHHHIPEKIIW